MPRQRENTLRTPRSSYRLRAGYRLKREWANAAINFVDENGIETGAIEADGQGREIDDSIEALSAGPDETDAQ